jgi:hypothetical protein
MSIQIERLMKKYPQIFYDVSYEGNGIDEYGDPLGDGTWLYMNPSWYTDSTDCGIIHEPTIKDVLFVARYIYQNKARWIDENPNDTKHIQLILSGAYDRPHKQ